jgi:hypothetical protein
MRAAARASNERGIREIRTGHSLGRILFAVVLAEFRRAVAAARRYEDLRYGGGRHEGVAAADVPRRVFEEFYSCAPPGEPPRADWNPQVSWHRSGARRAADQGERQLTTHSGKSTIEDTTQIRPPPGIQPAPLARMASGSSPHGKDLRCRARPQHD